ncbi:MAG: 30S ribosomal protein S6 [Bacteroidia bacterium]|nr:30S ribosomal protein S6 [Bacteroidia bacterium]
MVKQYETVFILTPVLSDEQAKEAVTKFRDVLKVSSAKITHEENWGLRKLAYSIQKKNTGFYTLFEFEAEGDAVAGLEIAFKRDERVLRFMTVSLDKHAQAWAAKRRGKHADKK